MGRPESPSQPASGELLRYAHPVVGRRRRAKHALAIVLAVVALGLGALFSLHSIGRVMRLIDEPTTIDKNLFRQDALRFLACSAVSIGAGVWYARVGIRGELSGGDLPGRGAPPRPLNGRTLYGTSMDGAVNFDVPLVSTTAVNSDGTPRQDILRECLAGGQRLLFVGEDPGRRRAMGIFVRRTQSVDDKWRIGCVGEFPPEYRHFREAGWTFEGRAYEITRDGQKLGMRVRGRFVPPPAHPVDEDGIGYDL